MAERHWEFARLWGMPVIFRYAPQRVKCVEHGIVIEHIPWSEGKRPLTTAMIGLLARWVRRMSWWELPSRANKAKMPTAGVFIEWLRNLSRTITNAQTEAVAHRLTLAAVTPLSRAKVMKGAQPGRIPIDRAPDQKKLQSTCGSLASMPVIAVLLLFSLCKDHNL